MKSQWPNSAYAGDTNFSMRLSEHCSCPTLAGHRVQQLMHTVTQEGTLPPIMAECQPELACEVCFRVGCALGGTRSSTGADILHPSAEVAGLRQL
jgi:hypothetical protein